MLSKATIKRIRALEQKKFRRQTGLFVAEGPKVVGDLLATMAACEIFATAEWLKKNQRLVEEKSAATITEISDEELRRLSFLQHPQQVLATFPIPASSTLNSQLSTVNYHWLSTASKTLATSAPSSALPTGLASRPFSAVPTPPTPTPRRWCRRRWEASPA